MGTDFETSAHSVLYYTIIMYYHYLVYLYGVNGNLASMSPDCTLMHMPGVLYMCICWCRQQL